MTSQISKQDFALRDQLESLTMSPNKFNHQIHLRFAYILLLTGTQKNALDSMRTWTFKFLEHHKINPAKYNETMTQAWMLAVRHFINKTSTSVSSDDFIRQNPTILNSEIMLTHYTRERLFSETARERFVEPDLDPIPRYSDVHVG